MATIEDFSKLELRVGTVLKVEPVQGSAKLLRFEIDLGECTETGESKPRQILSGIAKEYAPEALLGKQIIVIANLEPRTMAGFESNGMVLCAKGADQFAVLTVEKPVPPGATIS